MGADKAEVRLRGVTLLEIAVRKLQRICSEVVLVGERELVPVGVRIIPDLHRGCGPMGGMEAALQDLNEGAAMFLPVDMPFVPVDLLALMAEEWVRSRARVCLAVADGRVQPLVSMLRWDMVEDLRSALARGEYKVRPVLEGSSKATVGSETHGTVVRTEISTAVRSSVWPGWIPGDEAWAARELWFANLNTRAELVSAELVLETISGAGADKLLHLSYSSCFGTR